MAWVFICISAGAAGFLIFVVIDYLKASASLKPEVDFANAEIRECAAKIDAEQNATKDTTEQLASLKKEIGELEKELTELQRKVEEYWEREKRRKPTKFKLEE